MPASLIQFKYCNALLASLSVYWNCTLLPQYAPTSVCSFLPVITDWVLLDCFFIKITKALFRNLHPFRSSLVEWFANLHLVYWGYHTHKGAAEDTALLQALIFFSLHFTFTLSRHRIGWFALLLLLSCTLECFCFVYLTKTAALRSLHQISPLPAPTTDNGSTEKLCGEAHRV